MTYWLATKGFGGVTWICGAALEDELVAMLAELLEATLEVIAVF
jgi:hypothetical protein